MNNLKENIEKDLKTLMKTMYLVERAQVAGFILGDFSARQRNLMSAQHCGIGVQVVGVIDESHHAIMPRTPLCTIIFKHLLKKLCILP